MTAITLKDAFHLGSQPPVDRWLRFADPIQARYDQQTSAARVRELRSAILIGLALYNVYNITSIVLLPDIFLLSAFLRLVLVTPTSLALAWLIGRTSPVWTERLVTVGIFNAYLVPVFLFWFTNEPRGLFTFGELPLSIIFANMLLALRFPNALAFTLSVLAVSLAAVATKAGLDVALRFAFAMQIATACVFALYANYRHERRRCADFLTALAATLEADSANADRQSLQDQTRTDALTQLPNRRYLMGRLEEWLEERRPVAVMMIDVDHFKLYNDTLGHPAGDACLQHVAGALAREAARTGDAFCTRFGGEEFTFVLTVDCELEAVRRTRALVQAIADLHIPHPGRSDGVGVVTISIGLTHCASGETQSPGATIAAADRALYTAKQLGRNGFFFINGTNAPVDPARDTTASTYEDNSPLSKVA